MADQVRVFVSHHHGPEEDAFTARLVADLEAAGADVWVDDERITSDDFIKNINEGLVGRQWLVLVMTPDALHSPWVQAEVNAALNQVRKGRMLGVVPIVAKPCDDADIPPLLDALHRYDATRAYEPARDGLLHAMGLSLSFASAPPKSAVRTPQPAPVSVNLPDSPAPSYRLPDVPARLTNLGFRGINVNGTPAVVPPLISIPAGPFLMGSDKGRDTEARNDELPLHLIKVAEFQIARYPVTVAEYMLAQGAGGVRRPKPLWHLVGPTWKAQQAHPEYAVVNINWRDAMSYIAWLVSATGQRGWRLPTEAEWEKAARWDPERGVSHIYPWGDHFDKSRCNTIESGLRTTPIGSYPAGDILHSGASPYGVEEMAGTVREWTSSLYKPYPYTQDDGREDPQSTGRRTLRGGSWGMNAWAARAAFRDSSTPDIFVSEYNGFRLAFSPSVGS